MTESHQPTVFSSTAAMETSWKKGELSSIDPFNLKEINFTIRQPEASEMFPPEEAQLYIDGCDYETSCDDLLLAIEIANDFGDLSQMTILDAMCGPGRLGRELLSFGAGSVTFHDGAEIMINHAKKQTAKKELIDSQQINFIQSLIDQIPLPDNQFDLIAVHNSTHQLKSFEKLVTVTNELTRLLKPGGTLLIADYQRNTSQNFLASLEERLFHTKPDIVLLLIPTFEAAFSITEFQQAFNLAPQLHNCSVINACLPEMTPEMLERVDQDPVKGHVLDFSPISLRAIAQKEIV